MTPFLLSIFLFFVFLVAYVKLQGQVKKLRDELSSHLSNYNKLQDSESKLKAELQRLERRIDQLDQSNPETEQALESDVHSKDHTNDLQASPPIESKIPVAEETKRNLQVTTPPPLPQYTVSSKKKTTPTPPVTPKEISDQVEAPSPAAPSEPAEASFFERIPWRTLLERFHLWPPSKSEAGAKCRNPTCCLVDCAHRPDLRYHRRGLCCRLRQPAHPSYFACGRAAFGFPWHHHPSALA